jgi:hypothetical protein
MQLPLLVLLVRRWRRRIPLSPLERCAVGLALFAALQAAAVAHNRAGGLIDYRPLSRYQDPLLLGVAAQGFAVLRLAVEAARPGRLLALAWIAALLFGLLTLTTTNLTFNLPFKRAQDAAGIQQVRTYLATGDATVFTRDPLFPGPHPNPGSIQRVLDDPLLRPVLPAVFFSDRPEAVSGTRPWLIERGRSLALLAAVAFGLALVRLARDAKRPPTAPAAAPET